MKKVILILMFVPYLIHGQIRFDFENGNIAGWNEGNEGRWKADTIQKISGSFSLHHVFDNPSSGNDCVGTPLSNLHPSEGVTRWSFRIRHGCDPSSSNSWALYLMSDIDPASFNSGGPINGYAVGVNLTGYDDTLRLWKIKGGIASAISTFKVNWQVTFGTEQYAGIIVERETSGLWNLSAYNSSGILSGSGQATEAELFSPGWLILSYRYTSTRDRLLWIDDVMVEGIFREDLTPPEISECRLTGRNSLSLSFSESLSADFFQAANFFINERDNTLVRITKNSSSSVSLRFRDDFKNKQPQTLTIVKACDNYGNCSEALSQSFTPAWADPGDVIISEIMADPLPPVSLPAREYLEIYNRSGFTLNTVGWNLATEDEKSGLPDIIMKPGEYFILCSLQDTSAFSPYGKCAGVKSFPSLTDGGRIIALTDSSGDLIHGIEYAQNWYGSTLKSGGGWSLEIIDTGFPFYGRENWEASSSSKGGTPGRMNSASRSNPDAEFTGLVNVFPVSDNEIRVAFSEPVIGKKEYLAEAIIADNHVESVSVSGLLMQTFIVTPGTPLEAGRSYSLSLPSGITDFAGNQPERRVYRFGLPDPAVKGDLVFNEILFNPFPGEPDWIEFCNRSEKILDASALWLATVNSENGDTSEIRPLSEEGRGILPGTYYAISTDRDKVIERYPVCDPEALFSVSQFPSMPDEGGHIVLLDRKMEIIDEVIFTDDMHFPLLASAEGVSLEKLRPDLNSMESASWHSASESSGWGTPGRENLAFTAEQVKDDRMKFSSGRISPDNDGYEDVLIIDIDLTGLGNVVTVKVFDETGNFVRKVCENLYAGSSVSVVWDGTSYDGSLVPRGIYIIVAEIFNDKGKTKSWKKVVTVTI